MRPHLALDKGTYTSSVVDKSVDKMAQSTGDVDESAGDRKCDQEQPRPPHRSTFNHDRQNADHRPQLSDLRDSGSIEQDADIVMFIYREDVYYTEEEWEQHFPARPYPRNIAEIIVAKHRHGPTGSVKLRFRDNLVRFEPLPRAEGF